jgi:hypothetical protein
MTGAFTPAEAKALILNKALEMNSKATIGKYYSYAQYSG